MIKKIAIFQYDIGVGGIQRSLINLLASIDTKRYEIDLYLFSKDNPLIHELPKNINIIQLNQPSRIKRFLPFPICRRITRPTIQKHYDIAIDFNGHQNITASYALRTQATRHIYWVHNDHYVWRSARQHNPLKKLYAQITLTKYKWKFFDEFVGVSSGVLESFKKDFPNKKYWIIPNIIDTSAILQRSKEKIKLDIDKEKLNIVTVSRLEYEKGLDLFLPLLAQVVKQRPAVHFYIIGSGSCKKSLMQQVRRLGLDTAVSFLGTQQNPFKYLSRMDVFVLNSRYEGQGMVLREAQTLGLQTLFPKRLEKYNDGLSGVDNIVDALLNIRKKPHEISDLSMYNGDILSSIERLFAHNPQGEESRTGLDRD